MPPQWVKTIRAIAPQAHSWLSSEKDGLFPAPPDLEGRFQNLVPPRTHQESELLLPYLRKPGLPS